MADLGSTVRQFTRSWDRTVKIFPVYCIVSFIYAAIKLHKCNVSKFANVCVH